MKRVITFSVCLLLLVTAVTCVHKNKRPLWVARYDAPEIGWGVPNSIAVDNSGNVYVTGESQGSESINSAYATVKYDSLGNQLWAVRYNGPGIIHLNKANSLAVDNSGNVYVTGCSGGLDINSLDYATVKYDSLGNELWVARYDGSANEEDRANSIAVDNSGNVYVTGCSKGSALLDANMDYATIKYDSLGNQLWVARYDGSANEDDRAYSLALDNSGNVYVTGYSGGSGGINSDYATVKYDSLGSQLWVARYDGSANEDDRAYSLALDNSGNVYVTGCSKGSALL
ncbi:MAG: SBBP repeat-containing protein, partial [candidate division WOR-3 bacterium]|nr:SBBP repeat-containing protein [candidate division WOR-3 bacterium]